MIKGLCMAICAGVMLAFPAHAQDNRISEGRDSFQFVLNGAAVTISRSGATCPSSCVQPMQVAPGIVTLGELELMDFLEASVATGQGLLVDARLPEDHARGTVPGAVNLPSVTLRTDNPYRDDLLTALGVQGRDFSRAYSLLLFGSGADDPDPVQALLTLQEAGYPADKLQYYRGGLSAWTALGLNIATVR